MERKVKKKIHKHNIEKTWKTLLLIAATIFMIVGLVMVIIDARYLEGIQNIATSILFYAVLLLIKRRDFDFYSPFFRLGFIFAAVGPIIHFGVWALGFILVLASLFQGRR